MIPDPLKEFPLAVELDKQFGDAVLDGSAALGELALTVEAGRVLDICRYVRESMRFGRLSSVTCVDWHPAEPRFELVYLLHSLEKNSRLRIKCRVAGDVAEIDSVTPVWPGANWYEREIFDMFGVSFRGHPDMTRILMPDYWEGYPLRKDFPIHGHKYDYSNS